MCAFPPVARLPDEGRRIVETRRRPVDRMKVVVEAVIAVGLVGIWPGPALLSLVATGGTGAAPPVDAGPGVVVAPSSASAASWFQRTKPSCNAVEVQVRIARSPAPDGWEGRAYEAACFALAGRVDRARSLLADLEGDERWRAAGIVFDAGHPVADAGDDRLAGPLMELVVEFWPNHYMALYHAGMARYGLGDHAAAVAHLRRFLEHYDQNDGWRSNAITVLKRLGAD